MKAVIVLGGKQYIVSEKDTLLIDRLADGTKDLTLEPLMIFDEKTVNVGKPTVTGVKVAAKVVEPEIKGEKILIGKFQAKKRVKSINGHRQQYSKVQITSIK